MRTHDSFFAEVGRNIVIARKRRRWSRENLCARARISVSTLRRIEAGDSTVSIAFWIAALTAMDLVLPKIAAPEDDRVGLSHEIARTMNSKSKLDKKLDF